MNNLAQKTEDVQNSLREEAPMALGAIEDFFGWLEGSVREGVRITIEKAVAEEFRVFIGAGEYERGKERKDYRNGHRFRDFLCRLGLIKSIKIPRSRQGGFESKILPRVQRKEKWISNTVADIFLRGISTRKVKALSKKLWGKDVSASAVSEMNKTLREGFLQWINRPIKKKIIYLVLDAIHLSVKRAEVAKEALLCAVGFSGEGEREFLGFVLGGRESAQSWEDFLLHLKRRGVDEANLKLITVDGNPGNLKAISTIFSGVDVQRCVVHKLWNIEGKCPKTLKGVVGSEARRIFQATNETEVRERFAVWKTKWAQDLPKVVECLAKDFEECITYYKHPYRRWKKIRSTNIIERCFKEFRRRIYTMDSFPTEESCLRIMYGLAKMMNDNWEGKNIKEF